MRQRLLPFLWFASGFVLASTGTSVVAAVGLGWYDPKWGSPWGAVEVDLTLLPYFLAVAALGHGLALWALAERLAALTPAQIGRREFTSGALAPVLYALAAYTEQRLVPGTAIAAFIEAVDLGWLLIMPILVTLGVYLWAGTRASSRAARAL